MADVATGTGVWLFEVAREAPSTVQFDGFDISDEQFPHSSLLPENIRFHLQDATKEPPESMCGKYDVVHVRLLMAVIENNDPSIVLKHCKKLLSMNYIRYKIRPYPSDVK